MLHPLIERLERQSCLDSVENFLGVNAPARGDPNAPTDGFSYRQTIQPILDRHCVECHQGLPVGDLGADKPRSPLDLRGLSERRAAKQAPDDDTSAFTRSYLNLTNNGKVEGSQWVKWLEVWSRSAMLPPYFTGSLQSRSWTTSSRLRVAVSEQEKRAFACSTSHPFCGSHGREHVVAGR